MEVSRTNTKPSRLRRPPVALAALLTLCAAAAGQAQSPDVRELKPGKSVEREIKTGEPHRYRLALRRGQVLFVGLDEEGFDVKVELVEAAGGKSVAAMNLGGGFERETLTFEAGADGEYLLRVDDAEGKSVSGAYRLKARVADSAGEKDRARVEAERLLSEAAASQKEGTAASIREAVAKRERALALWQGLGDKYWEGHTLNRLGVAHGALLENNKAVEYFDRAMQVVKKLGDKKLEAGSHNGYGATLNSFGEYRQAIEYGERALRLFRETKHGIGEAASLTTLGNSYVGLKDYAKAGGHFQAGLAVARQGQNKIWEAHFLYMLGTVLEAQGDKPKALENYERALALWRQAKHGGGAAVALLAAAKVRTSQGETDKALQELNEALSLFKSEKLRGQETSTYHALFAVYNREGRAADSLEVLVKALDYYREFKIAVMEAVTAGLIASLHNTQGNYKEAIRYAEMSLAVEEKAAERTPNESKKTFESNMKHSKGMALNTIGSAYYNYGDGEKALEYVSRAIAVFEQLGDKESRLQAGYALTTLAQVYRQRYDWNKTRETYDRSLAIARELDDKGLMVMGLNSLGMVYDYKGDTREALRWFEETLAVVRSIPDRGDMLKRFEAATLDNIGGTYRSLGEPEKARDFYNQSLAVWQSIKDPSFLDGRAGAYHSLGIVSASLGRNQEAVEMLNKSLELFRQAPERIRALARNRTTEVRILNSLGNVYKNMGDLKRALENYELTFKRAVEVKDSELQAAALNGLAQVDLAYGEPQKALRNFNEALEIHRRIENKTGIQTLLNNIAQVHSYRGDQREAIRYTREALAVAEETGNKSEVPVYLNNIGNAYMALGENDEAVDYFKRSLAVARGSGNKSSECTTLNNLAVLYSNVGERGRAFELYEQAMALARSIGEKNSEATVLGNMAFDYLELGENRKALDARERALQISRESGDKSGELTHLIGLAHAYRKAAEVEKGVGRFDRAVALYEQTLTLSRAAESEIKEASALLGLGHVYVETGETAKALPHLTRALHYSRKHQDRYVEDVALVALGRLYAKEGKPGRAVEEYRGALTVARTISDKDLEAKALKGLMTASKALGDARSAVFYGKQAVNAYQQLRGSIRNLNRETQAAFRDKVTDAYRELSNLLIEQGRLPEAEQVLGMLKDAEFKQLQVRRGGEQPDTIPYSRAEADALAQVENLVALERERADLPKTAADKLPEEEARRRAELDRKIKEANAAFDRTLKALGAAAPSSVEAIGGIVQEQKTPIQGTLTTLRLRTGSRVAALYTVLGSEKSKGAGGDAEKKFGWVILFTEGGRKAYPIDVTNLNDLVSRFRDALGGDAYDPRPLAEKIYEALFRQTSPKQSRTLEADLREYFGARGDGTLMWSLDGVLRYIPMAALHDGESYLVEKYRNVVFRRGSRSLTDENRHDWQVLGLGLSEAREDFAALPGVKTELETIVRRPDSPTGILKGEIRLNHDFRKRYFLETVRDGSFPVVHIASHYSYNSAAQGNSFLLIGDGRLTFDEMSEDANLFGAVDLLTLSACDTATSANGEESEGFAFKAQELGAKSVIASLWKVSDAGTPELMTRFYRLRADDPTLPKGEAFRRAQLSLLRGVQKAPAPRPAAAAARGAKLAGLAVTTGLPPFAKDAGRPYAHPHYWASFVLIGNWR